MRNHLFLLVLGTIFFQFAVTNLSASDYVVNYGYDYGTYYFQNGASAENAYAAYWLSTQTEPQVKLAVVLGFNNMDIKNYKGALYVGSRTSPYEISVSEGFVITGYTIKAKAISYNQTITPSEGGATTTFTSAEESTLVVDGLRTESTRFELTGANTGLNILSFEVNVDADAERTADLVAHYEAAISTLTSGNQYWITTTYASNDQGTTRYYLNAEGALTSNLAEANVFTLSSVTAQSTFRPIAWQATGVSFSSPYIERGYLTNVNHIMTNIDESRNDWEAQVYLKGDDHYAVRSTNVNSAEYFANTYWAVTDRDGDGVPEANYSEERTYAWDVTPYNAAKEASILLAAFVEEACAFQVEACDATVASHYSSLLEQSRAIANPDFSSESHSEECITLLSQLRAAFDAVQASVSAYRNYQVEANKVRQAATNCTIAPSPLATELDALATRLQTSINNGTSQANDFLNLGSYIAARKEYWTKHLTDSELTLLRQVASQMSLGSLWNLDAEELTLVGVTITEGFVTGISLSSKGLKGQFPISTLLAMPYLTNINLSGNCITNVDTGWSKSITVDVTNQVLTDTISFSLPTADDSTLPTQLAPLLMYRNGALTTKYNIYAKGDTWEIGFTNSGENDALQFLGSIPFIYDRPNGDIISFTNLEGDAIGSTFPVQITFDEGDASFDGVIDVADLQIIINYIFNALTGDDAFNFTAANLWEDDIINVQDVVKEVDLLLSQTPPTPETNDIKAAPAPRRMSGRKSDASASLRFIDGQLRLDTESPVAALDIFVNCTGDVDWSNLQALGFSVTSRATASGVHIIAYSMSGVVIPEGSTTIATTSDHAAQVAAATLTDSAAKHINAAINTQIATGVGNQMFNEKLSNAVFFDLSGRKILHSSFFTRHSSLPKGVYIRNGRKAVLK